MSKSKRNEDGLLTPYIIYVDKTNDMKSSQ